MALITSLEEHVVPYLGVFRVPDTLVAQLGQILQRGSTIHQVVDMSSSPSSSSSPSDVPNPTGSKFSAHRKPPSAPSLVTSSLEKVELDIRYSELSSSHLGKTVPRERFSYWSFDLLFLICSRVAQGMAILCLGFTVYFSLTDQEHSRRRLATLSLPSLLNRCKATLLRFVADESLRGNIPFPRCGLCIPFLRQFLHVIELEKKN